MFLFIVSCVFCLVVGFGLGRVKNAEKLAWIKAEVTKLESYTAETAKAGLTKLKAKL